MAGCALSHMPRFAPIWGEIAEMALKNKGNKVTLLGLAFGSLSSAFALENEVQRRAGDGGVLEVGSELEVKQRKNTQRKSMTVDFNNFLPCLSMEDSSDGKSHINYRPVF